MAVQSDLREVDVARVNERGIQTSGGEWLNLSRYANAADVPLPQAGDRVLLHLDRQGFVRKIEMVAPATVAPRSEAGPSTDGSGEAPKAPPARDTVVTRLACLNTATAVLSSGGRIAEADAVIELAERLETWATR